MRALYSIAFVVASLLALGFVACSSDAGEETLRDCPPESSLDYQNFGGPFFLSWCTGCHNSALGEGERQDAPIHVNFDSLDEIRGNSAAILERAVHQRLMPPAGGPSETHRELLGEWLRCGAPGHVATLDAAPTVDDPTPAPSGQCAQPRQPLPSSVLPRCSAATYDCVAACAGTEDTDACTDACLAADTTPPADYYGYPVDCATCTTLQLLACGERRGCHEPMAEALCCSDRECPAGSPGDCSDTKCAAELRAFGLCLGYAADECVSFAGAELGSCFAR
jgi:hypothetical protein